MSKSYRKRFGFLRQVLIQDVRVCLHSHQFRICIKIFTYQCLCLCVFKCHVVGACYHSLELNTAQNFEGMKACIS